MDNVKILKLFYIIICFTNYNMEQCKVKNCQYSEYHVTSRHKCETCKKLGHGQIECIDIEMIHRLNYYKDDIISVACTIKDCVDRNTHITLGHDCLYCSSRKICNNTTNHLKHCPCNGTRICDSLNDIDIMGTLKGIIDTCIIKKGHYIIKYAGMGCQWFVRNNIMGGLNEYLFMHNDSWGQYGPDSDETPRYNAFLRGYILQEL